MEIHSKELASDVRLHLIPKDYLKTTVIKIFFHWPLGHETAHKAVLLKLLERGPSNYKNTLNFNRKLQKMYGADFVTGIHKKGERQILELRMEIVSQNFLPHGAEKEIGSSEVVSLLSNVIFNPVTDGQRFLRQRVERELKNHISRLKKQKDDKTNFAVERLIQNMCPNEPFRYSKFGDETEVNEITSERLYHNYKIILSSAPVDIFIMGNFDRDEIESKINDELVFPDRVSLPDFNVQVKHSIQSSREVVESELVNQGKLCLGYRTQTSFADENIFPLMVFNGALGGFPHSKLFSVVREKHSLCYYIVSRLEKSKGILVVNAGIDSDDFQKAQNLIVTEVDKMIKGDVREEQIEMSKKSLLSAIEQVEDNPDGVCEMLLEGVITGKPITPEEIRRKISLVTTEQVREVCKQIQLDTIYFMTDTSEQRAGVH